MLCAPLCELFVCAFLKVNPSVCPPDILKDQWSPALTLKTALLSVQALLASPEPSDPQVCAAPSLLCCLRSRRPPAPDILHLLPLASRPLAAASAASHLPPRHASAASDQRCTRQPLSTVATGACPLNARVSALLLHAALRRSAERAGGPTLHARTRWWRSSTWRSMKRL